MSGLSENATCGIGSCQEPATGWRMVYGQGQVSACTKDRKMDASGANLDPQACDCGKGDACPLWDTGNPDVRAKRLRDSRMHFAKIMDACVYCRRARAKAGNTSRDGCKKHLTERYLAYVTSPDSETYWSS